MSTPPPATLLLVDDDQEALKSLAASLQKRHDNFTIHLATTAEEAIDLCRKANPDVAIVDLTLDAATGPESGFRVVSALLALDPTIRVLVLTGHNASEFGIQALLLGACSFLQKPADPAHLSALIVDAARTSQLRREYLSLCKDPTSLHARTGLTTKSPAMVAVLEAIAYAGSNRQPVLLCGETGTGKGVLAHCIHSLKGDGPFIRCQPSYGTTDLVSSELFGHQRGAFTGAIEDRKGLIELAHRGTLFIDEVDELPHETQVLLLHVLQERTFRRVGSSKEQQSDFRLLAATNRPIAEIKASKKIRDDFFHRIAHFTIELPPLRQRLEDIPDLAGSFVQNLVTRENLRVQGITPEAIHKMQRHSWPGNIRELQAAVEGGTYRAAFYQRAYIEPEDIAVGNDTTHAESTPLPASFRERIQQYELQLVEQALQESENNQSRAAERLQLDRTSFRRILQRRKREGS